MLCRKVEQACCFTQQTQSQWKDIIVKAQVLLYTCERQVLKVGVTEHLQGKKIEVHVCFIDVQDREK